MCASKSALWRTRAGARREAGAGGEARAVPPAPVTVPPDEGCASNSESEADTDARVGSRSSSPKHDSKQTTGIWKIIAAPHARSHRRKLAKQAIAAAVELASAASMVAAGRAAAACVSAASLHAGLSESTTGVAFACAWAAAYARMLAGAAYMSVQASRGRMLPRREQLSCWECAALLVRGAVVLSPADATVALLASRGARAAGTSPLALPDVGFGVLDAALALLAYCVWFVVTNFVLEAAFDFAHYWLHRSMHMSPVLYRHLHARHHLHTRPVALCLLEQSMGEYWLASTVLPCAFAQVVARYVRSGTLSARAPFSARSRAAPMAARRTNRP